MIELWVLIKVNKKWLPYENTSDIIKNTNVKRRILQQGMRDSMQTEIGTVHTCQHE